MHPNPVSQIAMRRAAVQQATERAAREGLTMVVTRQYRSDQDGGPIWYVRSTEEPPSGGALMDTVRPDGTHTEAVRWTWPYRQEDISTIETVAEYRAALARADWTFAYSDDPRVYREGKHAYGLLRALSQRGDEWRAAWTEARDI